MEACTAFVRRDRLGKVLDCALVAPERLTNKTSEAVADDVGRLAGQDLTADFLGGSNRPSRKNPPACAAS